MRQSHLKPLEKRYTPGQGVHRARHRLNRVIRGVHGTPATWVSGLSTRIKELLDFSGGVEQNDTHVMAGMYAKGLPKRSNPGFYTPHQGGGRAHSRLAFLKRRTKG